MSELRMSVKINDSNPVHTRVSVFTNSKRHGFVGSSKGLAGELVVDTTLLEEFIARVDPDSITWIAEESPPDWISKFYRPAEGWEDDPTWKVFIRRDDPNG